MFGFDLLSENLKVGNYIFYQIKISSTNDADIEKRVTALENQVQILQNQVESLQEKRIDFETVRNKSSHGTLFRKVENPKYARSGLLESSDVTKTIE